MLIIFLYLVLTWYFYFYFGYMLSYIISKEYILLFYSYFLNYGYYIITFFKINQNIILLGKIKNANNLLIINHSSIVDNLLIAYILNLSKINYLQVKTVSKCSSRNIQNNTMKYLNHLLVFKNIKKDIINLKKIIPIWKKIKNLNVIIFPEGTIVTKTNKCKYKYLLKPFTGLINNLKSYLNFDNIYDITFCYSINNKKLYGEKEILLNILNPLLKINIIIKNIKLEIHQELFITELWENKDKLIDKVLKGNTINLQ